MKIEKTLKTIEEGGPKYYIWKLGKAMNRLFIAVKNSIEWIWFRVLYLLVMMRILKK